MKLIDSHTHLHFPDFDQDREEVIQRALNGGVEVMINVATDVVTARQSVDLAEKYESIFAVCGFHPHDVSRISAQDWVEIENLLNHARVCGIGEVGLDFYRNLSPQDEQIRVFERFLQLYRQMKKPLVIHCRDAYEEMLEILTQFGDAPYAGVMHCFSSEASMMSKYLDLGFYISFAGPLTFKKSDLLREACRVCPLDRLLLETDAPFLAPEPWRGKRNEPLWVTQTVITAAKVHQISPEDMAARTSENAKRLFRL